MLQSMLPDDKEPQNNDDLAQTETKESPVQQDMVLYQLIILIVCQKETCIKQIPNRQKAECFSFCKKQKI